MKYPILSSIDKRPAGRSWLIEVWNGRLVATPCFDRDEYPFDRVRVPLRDWRDREHSLMDLADMLGRKIDRADAEYDREETRREDGDAIANGVAVLLRASGR